MRIAPMRKRRILVRGARTDQTKIHLRNVCRLLSWQGIDLRRGGGRMNGGGNFNGGGN